MKLDDRPLLELLAQRSERFANLEQAVARAVPLIETEFAPFENYCGKVAVTFASGSKTTITAAWRYRLPCGSKMAIKANLELHPQGWIMKGNQRSVNVLPLSPEAVAAAFVQVNETVAEAAFEAVVLGEGWRLRHFLQ